MVKGAILQGIRAIPIDIEIGLAPGSGIRIVGLPRDAVREAHHRLHHALPAAGFVWPDQAVTINLGPAMLQKREAGLDLPLALCILLATGQIKKGLPDPLYAFGELGLDGRVKGCRGALSVGRMVPEGANLIAAKENELELALLRGLKGIEKSYRPFVADSLAAAASILPQGRGSLASAKRQDFKPAFLAGTDFKEIKGQVRAKRALEVAAAGGHNVLLIGPPGEGKTLLARGLPTILPRLEPGEIVELTEIYSIKGLLSTSNEVVVHRPYRPVHHQASSAAIVGGGARLPEPGEITLAHRGVLFMDELPLFGPQLLNTLRQPLEDGKIHVARVEGSVTFPSEFILVAAMNPCACGFEGEFLCGKCDGRVSSGDQVCPVCGATDRRARCKCTGTQISTYRARLSGPVLDRIDLKIRVSPLSPEERFTPGAGESSHEIRRRVEAARGMQKDRFQGTTIKLNARIPGGQVGRYCELQVSARRALEEVNRRVPELTTRGFDQLLKVSRTVADLNNSSLIYKKHVIEAADLCGNEAVKGFLVAHTELEQCPGCGVNIDIGDRFCRRCGHELAKE